MKRYTTILSQFASNISYSELPPKVIDQTKTILLDTLGGALAGCNTQAGQILVSFVSLVSVTSECTIIGTRLKAAPDHSALANGVMAYSLSLNDIHRKSQSHIAVCVIPAVLAIGEYVNARGEELIASIVAGYEVMARVGTSISPSHRQKGFQPTATCGCFGAAAAAGRLLQLNPERLSWAMGIAGSQAAGLYEFLHDGSMTMIFHAGEAARNGVTAALFSKLGFTGPTTILEGSEGFCQAVSDQWDAELLIQNLGKEYEILNVEMKPYCACRLTHSGIDAVLEILRQNKNFSVKRIEQIKVGLGYPWAVNNLNNPTPKTPVAARMSYQMNLAVTLQTKCPPLRELTEDIYRKAEFTEFSKKISLFHDPSLPQLGAKLEILLKGGETYSARVEVPKGDPHNPLSTNELHEKFHRLVDNVIGRNKADDLEQMIDDLPNVKVRDLTALLQL